MSLSLQKWIDRASLCERLARNQPISEQALAVCQFVKFWVKHLALGPGIIVVHGKTAGVYCTASSLFFIQRYHDTGTILLSVEQVVLSIDGAFYRRSN